MSRSLALWPLASSPFKNFFLVRSLSNCRECKVHMCPYRCLMYVPIPMQSTIELTKKKVFNGEDAKGNIVHKP